MKTLIPIVAFAFVVALAAPHYQPSKIGMNAIQLEQAMGEPLQIKHEGNHDVWIYQGVKVTFALGTVAKVEDTH